VRKSHELSLAELDRLSVKAEILVQSKYGIKVMCLENGDILKLFRVKRIFSSTHIYSYARRFCRNACRLKKLGIATVTIKQLFHFVDSSNTAVLYQPLAGESLWQLASTNKLSEKLLTQLGEFVAGLHQRGIYFRSLHLGNIILTPTGELGLVDISDMSIFPWKLGYWRRLRNFKQTLRRPQGIHTVGLAGWNIFFASYIASSQISPRYSNALSKKLTQALDIKR
jgi:tRNA A-37 threonylcarbamoyl transferase component Bud32